MYINTNVIIWIPPLAFDYQGEHQKTAFFRKIDFEKHPNIVKNGQQKNL